MKQLTQTDDLRSLLLIKAFNKALRVSQNIEVSLQQNAQHTEAQIRTWRTEQTEQKRTRKAGDKNSGRSA